MECEFWDCSVRFSRFCFATCRMVFRTSYVIRGWRKMSNGASWLLWTKFCQTHSIRRCNKSQHATSLYRSITIFNNYASVQNSDILHVLNAAEKCVVTIHTDRLAQQKSRWLFLKWQHQHQTAAGTVSCSLQGTWRYRYLLQQALKLSDNKINSGHYFVFVILVQ